MKIAVIGLGFMGLTHLKALRAIPDAEVVAVASNDAQRSGDAEGQAGRGEDPGVREQLQAGRERPGHGDLPGGGEAPG